MKTQIKKIQGNNEKGKRVLILTGVHGDEMTPIYTISKMIKDNLFNIDNIKSLTILNGVNVSGIINSKREIVSNSSSDLNRILTNEVYDDCVDMLYEYIDKNDVVIDIHSSPCCTEFALVDIDEYTTSIKKWCDESGLLSVFRYSGASTIKRYCLEKGKMAITFEINMMKKIDFDSANKTIQLINNLLSNTNMKIYKSSPNVKEMRSLYTYTTGMLLFNYKNGETFKKGDVLYKIVDLDFKELYKYNADCNGVVVIEPDKSFVKRGDDVYTIQETKK